MGILWIFYPVPAIVKSRSECPKNPLFMENVELLPGTANIAENEEVVSSTDSKKDFLCKYASAVSALILSYIPLLGAPSCKKKTKRLKKES